MSLQHISAKLMMSVLKKFEEKCFIFIYGEGNQVNVENFYPFFWYMPHFKLKKIMAKLRRQKIPLYGTLSRNTLIKRQSIQFLATPLTLRYITLVCRIIIGN
jgi:hypothetical protein